MKIPFRLKTRAVFISRSLKVLATAGISVLALGGIAQVNSGSDGRDGVLNPTTNTVINMADHPDGIYRYLEVNIVQGLTLSFVPNSNNTPVFWLVQSNCTIAGTVSVNGPQGGESVTGANGGPGAWRGGNGAPREGLLPESGYGPGGGKIGVGTNWYGGNASHSTLGARNTNEVREGNSIIPQHLPGDLYGNIYGIPLWGGSGGSGSIFTGGGGGGGAILLAVGGTLTVSGTISAKGGNGYYTSRDDNSGIWWEFGTGGAGSGGTIRVVASSLSGNGFLDTGGGSANYGIIFGQFSVFQQNNEAGNGRIRIEALFDTFTGGTRGATARGYTGIILAPTNQQSQLFIRSIAGQPVSTTPTGSVITPDALIGSQQLNPVSIAVTCIDIPLNSDIIVEVRPANGPYVSAVGRNNSGAFALSTATVLLNIPRGGGTIQARVATAN